MNDADVPLFDRINNEAFPPSERMSMAEIFELGSKTDTDVLGIYDSNQPVGFTVVMKNEVCGYVFFYAIDERFRSKGYGSAAIKRLVEEYNGLQLILDFESIDENTDNFEQRKRRKQFYLKNGFRVTGRYTKLSGEMFEVVYGSGEEFEVQAFERLLEIIHSNIPEFSNILY